MRACVVSRCSAPAAPGLAHPLRTASQPLHFNRSPNIRDVICTPHAYERFNLRILYSLGRKPSQRGPAIVATLESCEHTAQRHRCQDSIEVPPLRPSLLQVCQIRFRIRFAQENRDHMHAAARACNFEKKAATQAPGLQACMHMPREVYDFFFVETSFESHRMRTSEALISRCTLMQLRRALGRANPRPRTGRHSVDCKVFKKEPCATARSLPASHFHSRAQDARGY